MSKPKTIDEPVPGDADYDAIVAEIHAEEEGTPIVNPVLDRRQAYLVTRGRIVDTSLDEGEKLYKEGCIRRGSSPSHFVFTGKNETKTRQDIHIEPAEYWNNDFWSALLCSCPTGRHYGDPCWHKGAVRAYLADNPHIRHANALLSLPLR